MVGKRVLQGLVWNDEQLPGLDHDLGDEFCDFGDKSKIPETIFSISLLGDEIRIFQIIPCDVTACTGDYKRTVLGSQSSSVLIVFERVDRLEQTLEFRLQCELESR
ncbi:hypothetical protein AVEN_60461-1 [Araneus ventricosus]|uniref:Uncharacterized protein n=1 Tax=Araneus ventricosus TaxID=182803 RepID=A0A4Y2KBL5_ARAVE|nr:hypothetical protein AVEN_60461-1 [Araneus ventricosus]